MSWVKLIWKVLHLIVLWINLIEEKSKYYKVDRAISYPKAECFGELTIV